MSAQALAHAQAAFRAGDFTTAARLADELVARQPALMPALQLAALAHMRLGRPDLARERLEAALKAAPGDPNLVNSYGNVLDALGETGAALAAFRRALQIAPSLVDAHLNLGRVALKAGETDAAVAAYRRACELAPDRPGAWHGLGLAHAEAADPDAAAQALDRSLSVRPTLGALHARARLEHDRGRDSLPFWDRALAAAPGQPDLLVGRAAALRRAGDEPAAIAALEALVQAQPDALSAHAALAKMRFEAGQADGFDAGYAEALARSANPAALWAAWFSSLLQAGRPDQVLARLDAARPALGDSAGRYEAAAAVDAGQLERAEAALGGLDLSRDPELQLVNLRFLLKAGRPDAAARFGEPLALEAGRRNVWPYLGLAWRLTGDARWEWLEGDPRLIGADDLPLSAAELAETAEALRGLHRSRTHPLDQTLRGGSQTEGDLFALDHPAIGRLKAALSEAVRRFVDQLPPPDPRHPLLGPPRERFRFTGAWSVRLTGQGFHINHVHEKGWISSAFYVVLPPGVGEGAEDRAGWLAFGQPPAELGLSLEPVRLIAPKPGRLALFSSLMWHGTLPFDEGERLTVAFDVASLGGAR
ncbi:2OG-Fe(II) oxygenase family protein [Phenylobacterium terrae]|uniref:2OG-Fe(II) oxygenase family protein n=1 Tax=Phenylobacterium terrae TaxID=2665495 RepID=A0ABW4N0A0_9CAUL